MNKVKAVLMNVLQILKGWFTDKKVLIWLGILALPVIIAFVTVVAVYNHFAPELPSLLSWSRSIPSWSRRLTT